MQTTPPPDPCQLEIKLFGMHLRANGTVAVLVAGSVFVVYLGFRLL